MNLTPVKTPKAVKNLFPNYIWNIDTPDKTLYLTFDDGPTPIITPWTLDLLKAYNAKATFFCIGNNVKKHPEIYEHIISEGHSIGNHTQNHLKGWRTKTSIYLDDIEKASHFISTKLFRPPYGKLIPKQSKQIIKLGYKIIMWDVLSIDWDKNTSKEKCLKNVTEKVSNGSIIVFHDSIKAATNMQYALPKVLEYFSEKGYTFKRIVAQDL